MPRNYEQLSEIAPTVLVDYQQRDVIAVYRDVATWVGRKEVFDKHYAQYQDRIAKVRAMFSTPPSDQTVVYAHAYPGKASMLARRYYGSALQVAYDLGFKETAFMLNNFPGDSAGGKVSAEVLGDINPDYFLSSYRHQVGETPDSVNKAFDDVAPGWQGYLKAYKDGHLIRFNREKGFPTSFVSLNYILDEFEKVAR